MPCEGHAESVRKRKDDGLGATLWKGEGEGGKHVSLSLSSCSVCEMFNNDKTLFV